MLQSVTVTREADGLDVQHHGEIRTPEFCKCPICNREFLWEWQVHNHMKEHDPARKKHACMYCPYRAYLKSDVTKHERIHTGEKPYKCDKCQYRTTQKSCLVRHERTHNPQPERNTLLKCHLCLFQTNQFYLLQEHLQSTHISL